MTTTYKFDGGSPRRRGGFDPLPPGDYNFVVTSCDEPYQKANGNWVLKVRLAIEPGGETIFDQPWSGKTSSGDLRYGIGDFLLAVNRAPADEQDVDWRKVVGARGKCKLKIEIATLGAMAGKEVNKVHFYYTPRELKQPTPELAPPVAQTDEEPDDIPF